MFLDKLVQNPSRFGRIFACPAPQLFVVSGLPRTLKFGIIDYMIGALVKGGIGSIRSLKVDGFNAGIVIGTLMSWAAFWSLVIFSAPETVGLSGLAIFYLSLILGASGIFYLVGFYLRKKFLGNSQTTSYVFDSLRQAILISLGLCGILGLLKFQILNILTAFLIIGALVFFELFLRTK
jgi:hypothetical protein